MGFSDASFWEERYSRHETSRHEWLSDGYDSILNTCLDFFPKNKSATCLVLGCGDSKLSVDLAALRPNVSVMSTDVSESCIRNMSSQYGHVANVVWAVADMLALRECPEVSRVVKEQSGFDCVIEKAAIDALLADEKSQWNPCEGAWGSVQKCLSEVSCVLRPDQAVFLSFSFHQPHFRVQHYITPGLDWSLNCSTLDNDNGFHFYFYAMHKGKELDFQPIQAHLDLAKKYKDGLTAHKNHGKDEILDKQGAAKSKISVVGSGCHKTDTVDFLESIAVEGIL